MRRDCRATFTETNSGFLVLLNQGYILVAIELGSDSLVALCSTSEGEETRGDEAFQKDSPRQIPGRPRVEAVRRRRD